MNSIGILVTRHRPPPLPPPQPSSNKLPALSLSLLSPITDKAMPCPFCPLHSLFWFTWFCCSVVVPDLSCLLALIRPQLILGRIPSQVELDSLLSPCQYLPLPTLLFFPESKVINSLMLEKKLSTRVCRGPHAPCNASLPLQNQSPRRTSTSHMVISLP